MLADSLISAYGRWRVHGTTRSVAKNLERLMSICPEAKDNLKLFECDVLEAGGLDAPMIGCDALLHVASPFFFVGANEDNCVSLALS
jgi:hypothetical protein